MVIARAAAIVVMFLTLTACGLQGLSIGWSADHEQTGSAAGPWATVVVTFAAGLAIAGVLESLYQIGIHQEHAAAPAVKPDNTAAAIGKLASAMIEFRDHLPAAVGRAVAESVPADAPPPPPPAITPAIEHHLAQMVRLLEELKEVSMLDDAQRQARRQQSSDRRKFDRLDESARLIGQHQWEQADAVVLLLESLFPGDGDVIARRAQLTEARNAHVSADWEQVVRQIEDQMALSRYDAAIEVVDRFTQTYPNHVDGRLLAERVRGERDIATEKGVTRLYEQIRTSVDARQWRAALDGVQQFFVKFPDHPRVEKMRPQVRVIQKNAEIEERHEAEGRIGELVKSQRYDEAIEVGESLLARFPDSPQAAALTDVIVKLRERAAAGAPRTAFAG